MKTAFLIFAGFVALATAAEAQTLDQQMARCMAMTGTLQRLACYDAAAHGAGVSPAPRPTSAASAYAPPPAGVPPAQTFASAPPASGLGSERLPATVARQNSQSLVAAVSEIRFDGYGRFTVTLANGQVWRQLPGDETFLRNPKITQVKITRGAIGSYDLAVPGLHSSYRVTRIK